MKIITTKKEAIKNGKKKTIKVLGIPVVRKRRTSQKKEMVVCGIKVQNKKVRERSYPKVMATPTPNNNQVIYVAEILNKALEANLREMRRFQLDADKRLTEIETRLKKIEGYLSAT